MDIKHLSLRQKLGQLIVTGFPLGSMSFEFVELVKKYKVGNVILFSYNVESRAQLTRLCNDIQALIKEETGENAFITIDQEGGAVTRLPKDSFHMPGAMAIASTGDSHNAYEAAYRTGVELRDIGINFNLAPDMDINNNPHNPVIGVRSFGNTPDIVAEYGLEMIRGYQDANVMCLAKHFPGHGDTATDSHLSLPCISKTYEELEKMELIPFKAAIDAQVPAITTAHILYPELEEDKIPATMSKRIITDILKQRLGFNGLVISDCLEMSAIKEEYTITNGAIQALKAGVDLIFISHTASAVKEAIEAMEEAVLDGRLSLGRVEEAVAKVLYYKQKYTSRVMSKQNRSVLEENKKYAIKLMKKSITYVNNQKGPLPALGAKPLFMGCKAYRDNNASRNIDNTLSFSVYMAKALGGDSAECSIQPDEDEIQKLIGRAMKHSCLIIGTYNGYVNKGQIALVSRLAKLKMPTIMIALKVPYDLDEVTDEVYKLAAYEYSQMSFDAICSIL